MSAGILTEGVVQRFYSLFRGGSDSHGRFYPTTGSGETIHGAYGLDDVRLHLQGELGLGVVPIMPDSTCFFGCIDIDAHGDDTPDIDLEELHGKAAQADLPLIICRSKSGGAHCYLFGSEPLKVDNVRRTLRRWSEILGYGTAEVFPKQSKLEIDSNGERQLGSWLNLCFFDAQNEDQLRYLYDGRSRKDINYFLDQAEGMRLSNSQLIQKSDPSKNGAPPCLTKIMQDGVEGGTRNTAFYSLCVYLKKAYPESWRAMAYDKNAKVLQPPMPHDEATKVMNSVGRRDYRYKCQEEPLKSNCNSAVCVDMEHGITKEDKQIMEVGEMPELTDLRRIMTDPVNWILSINGNDVTFSTKEIMEFRRVREKIADIQMTVVPNMKNEQWNVILAGLMKQGRTMQAPESTTKLGQVKVALEAFIARVIPPSVNETTQEIREPLRGGNPICEIVNNEHIVMFRGVDFQAACKRADIDMTPAEIWLQVKKIGGMSHGKVRVGRGTCNVWKYKLNDVKVEALFGDMDEVPALKAEF